MRNPDRQVHDLSCSFCQCKSLTINTVTAVAASTAKPASFCEDIVRVLCRGVDSFLGECPVWRCKDTVLFSLIFWCSPWSSKHSFLLLLLLLLVGAIVDGQRDALGVGVHLRRLEVPQDEGPRVHLVASAVCRAPPAANLGRVQVSKMSQT
jgi:hypothetical protein